MSGLFRGLLTALAVRFTPVGGISATTVQDAITEVDAESVKLTGDQTVAGIKTFSSSVAVRVSAGGVSLVADTQSSGAANLIAESTGASAATTSLILRRTTGSTWNWIFRAGIGSANVLDILNGATVRQKFTSTLTEFQNSPIAVTDTTASTSTTTGSARFAGGVGVAGDAHIGGNVIANGLNLLQICRPAFMATSQADQTQSTDVAVVFGNEQLDTNSAFSGSNFVVPSGFNGTYLFGGGVYITNLDASPRIFGLQLQVNGVGYRRIAEVAIAAGAGIYVPIGSSLISGLTAGQTVTLVVNLFGASFSYTVSSVLSHFWGFKLPI
ncbi:hypothetical protein H6G36_25685 [Anabaena minutissima FACHB-250]|nr:hypothetical protein [Anabaena minutissima FACHB-250]